MGVLQDRCWNGARVTDGAWSPLIAPHLTPAVVL